jgi:hypothetical protein
MQVNAFAPLGGSSRLELRSYLCHFFKGGQMREILEIE